MVLAKTLVFLLVLTLFDGLTAQSVQKFNGTVGNV